MNTFWTQHSTAKTYVEALQNYVCVIEFTKLNGEKRKMRCTLIEKYLPEDNRKDQEQKLHMRKGLNIPVWDLDNNGWRSFLPNSIDSFNVEKCL